MQEYKVEIKETLSRIVTVEAENENDAIDRVASQGICLDANDDFQDVKFEMV